MFKEPLQLSNWDQIDAFTSLEAGCLWFDLSPAIWVLSPSVAKAMAKRIAEELGIDSPDPIVSQFEQPGRRKNATRKELIT